MPDAEPPRLPSRGADGRTARAAAVGAGVAALAAVVALASRSRPGDGTRRELEAPDIGLDWLLWVGLAVGLVIVVGVVLGAVGGPKRGRQRPRLSLLRTLAFTLVVLALALVAPHLREVIDDLRGGGEPPAEADPSDVADEPATPPPGGSSPAVLGLAAVGALGAAALAAVLRRRRSGEEAAAPALEETLDRALAEGIDDLRTATDLRAAVIAAYARMERALAAAGARRAPPETTREYVERVLATGEDAPAPAAVRDLGRLYESARYGGGPVDPATRDEAVGALLAVRAALAAVPA